MMIIRQIIGLVCKKVNFKRIISTWLLGKSICEDGDV